MGTPKEKLVVIYGTGASFDSGYEVKIPLKDEDDKFIAPPTDKDFFGNIHIKQLLQERYYALSKLKIIYYSNVLSLESFWTEIDLNLKHITLGTFAWEKDTEQYMKEIDMGKTMPVNPNHEIQDLAEKILSNSETLNKYEHMDSIPPGIYLDSRQYNQYKFWGDCGRNLRELIYDVFSDFRLKDDKEDNYKKFHDMIFRLIGPNLIAYITFNYDCFLESAIGSETKSYEYIGNNKIVTEKDIDSLCKTTTILKLHGSLNWEHNNSIFGDIKWKDAPFEKNQLVQCDYRQNSNWTQTAIIPPTIFKQEINDDSKVNDKLTKTILNQWTNAITILEHADKLIFVGYSFPPTDFHVKRLFRIANMRRIDKKKSIAKVLCCVGEKEDKEDEEKTKEQLVDIGFDDISIAHEFSKLVADGGKEVANFLHS